MFRRAILFGVISILLMALPIAAQEQAGNLGRVYFIKPKAGMELQYEEAAKRHTEWHRQQKDTWTWHTWQVVIGERLGQYVVGTFNHTWEDFDAHAEFDAADTAHVLADLSKYTASVRNVITRYRPDISTQPRSDTPLPLSQLFTYRVKSGKLVDFNYYERKVYEAIKRTRWPARTFWHRAINGTNGSVFYRISSRENWAGFKPPDKSFAEMMTLAYGPGEAEALREVFRQSVGSMRSETVQYRPDLSYIPAGQ